MAFFLSSIHLTDLQLPAASQRGTGMLEFLLVAMPLLLTALGGIEISHWMFTRQAVNLALAEAGRAGSTLHANPQAMIEAFEQALEPLYPPTESATSAQRVRAAMQRHQVHHQQLPWHIQLMSPTPAHFHDFKSRDTAVTHGSGLATINNSYQLEHHDDAVRQGWPAGKGPQSGQTIFQANTLALRLTWRYKPLLPGIERITGGPLSMTQDITLTMQSHPVLWPDDPAGRVTRSAGVQPRQDTGNAALPPPGPFGDTAPSYFPSTDNLLPAGMPAGQLTAPNNTQTPYPPSVHGNPASTQPVANAATPLDGDTGSNMGGVSDTSGGAASNVETAQTPWSPGQTGPGQAQTGPVAGSGHDAGTLPQNELQGFTGDDAGVAEGNMCTNISPSLTMPSSERARSSMASLPDFRS